MTSQWGILGPGSVESTRRVRTFRLAASTRHFNDLAVPGLGGIWYGKQLFLATLGVLVAERAVAQGSQVTKIMVANAIEALACWFALTGPHRGGDSRIRGSTKLKGLSSADFRFQNVSRPSFYVTQPMRMATVTALPALGLVENSGSRFNGFACSDAGLAFVEAASRLHRPFNRCLIDHLLSWVLGKDDRVDTYVLRQVLSPLTPLSGDALVLLRECLFQGAPNRLPWERQRRSDALHWVASRRSGAEPSSWNERPGQIQNAEHWADMQAGASFFSTQNAAHALLDELEMHIGTPENRFSFGTGVPERVHDRLSVLRVKAQAFLALEHGDAEANTFCREVVVPSDEAVLRQLVDRDGRILRLVGNHICPGSAFKGGESPELTSELDVEEGPAADDPDWPEGISYRIRNLWWLSLDLDGRIEEWLNPTQEEVANG